MSWFLFALALVIAFLTGMLIAVILLVKPPNF